MTLSCETLLSFRPVRRRRKRKRKKKKKCMIQIIDRIKMEKGTSTNMASDLSSGVEVLVLDLRDPDVGVLIWGLAEVALSALLSSALVF